MYTYDKWRERTRNRSDISTYLTHLTKPTESMSSLDRLLKILNERKVEGSSLGYINGGERVVCFQDAPLYGISQNVKHEQLNHLELGGRIRYEACGLSFQKPFIFRKGGRPVIYEKPAENGERGFRDVLPNELLWRVVSFDLSDGEKYIDWTHEREWRIRGDLTFDFKDSYVILPDASRYIEFVEKADDSLIKSIRGIIVLESILY